MPARRNITVAIKPALLEQARAIAARRGLSVSALLADELRELIGTDRTYAAAMLENRFHLQGAKTLDRSQLHARDRLR